MAAVAAMPLHICGIARGATIRDDISDSLYTALSAAYPSSAYLTVNNGTSTVISSATLIAPGYLITAARNVTQNTGGTPAYLASQITAGFGASSSSTGPLSVASIQIEPGWNFNFNNGVDVALIQLSSPVTNVAPAQLYNASLGSELTQTATMVGYGTTGTGLTGASKLNFGTRRAVQNTVDTLGGAMTNGGPPRNITYDFSKYSSNIMLADFDDPNSVTNNTMGSSTPLPLEGITTLGDYGGGLFLTVNNQNYLAGVTDFTGAFSSNSYSSTPDGHYGDYAGYDRVDASATNSFINSVLVVSTNWAQSGGGTYASFGNWTNTIPEFAQATANFDASITSASTVTLDGNWTVGTVNFNNANSYTVAPGTGGTLTLDAAGGTAAINVQQGLHSITAPVALNSNLLVTIAPAAGALTMSGGISGTSGLTLAGSGTLTFASANSYTGGTTINGGQLILQSNTPNALPAGSLTINGGSLNLTNNAITITYTGTSPINTIKGYVNTGYNGGQWNGPGIMSTSVAGNSHFGIGYADAADPGNPANLTAGTILVEPALLGDTNLDGSVNFADYQNLLLNFGQPGGWDQGNFLDTPVVNFADYQALLLNFNNPQTLGSGSIASIQGFAEQFGYNVIPNASGPGFTFTQVPEPGSLGLVGMGIGTLLMRRRIRTRNEV